MHHYSNLLSAARGATAVASEPLRERQADGSGANHSPASAAPQMGNPPEDPMITADEVTANVMQPRRLAARHAETRGFGQIQAVEGGMHFGMIEKRCAPERRSLAIDRGS